MYANLNIHANNRKYSIISFKPYITILETFSFLITMKRNSRLWILLRWQSCKTFKTGNRLTYLL